MRPMAEHLGKWLCCAAWVSRAVGLYGAALLVLRILLGR